ELALGGQAEFKVISLANPDRLVIDLPGSRLANGFKLPAPAGLVKAVRSGQPEPGVTRIVFDLATAVVAMRPRMEPSAGGARLVVEWPDEAGGGGDPIAALIADVSRQDQEPPAAADPTRASNAATDRLISQMAGGNGSNAAPAETPPPASVATVQPQPVPVRQPAPATAQAPVAQQPAPVPAPVQPA